MVRMANGTEKDLNINIRNYIQELNNDKIDFMSTIGTKNPRDLHINGEREIGTDENNNPIYETVYGKGIRGTGIDIDASNKIEAYFKNSDFNSLIDYWNKTVREAIRDCKQIIGNYDKDNLITEKNGDIILKDAANSFYAHSEYVSPWNNFTNQNYLDARSDENLDVLTNNKYLDYTQSYNRNTLNDMINSDESSDNSQERLVSHIELLDIEEKQRFSMGVRNTNTGYSISLTKINSNNTNNSSNNIDEIYPYCFLENYSYESEENEKLAEISNSKKIILYILRVLSQPGTNHTELFFEKQIINKNQILDGGSPNVIEVVPQNIQENSEIDSNNIQTSESSKKYNLLNNIIYTINEENPAGYSGVTWQVKVGNKVGFKTIKGETIECYSVNLSIGKTYKNYSIILAALTNLIMPQYKRRVEIEDLNRNFWVISQNLTILNKFMIGLQDGIGKIFQDIFSEIIGLWDNIYSIWKSIFYLDSKIDNFDRELNEIGIATSKVKVKISYENTFYHEDWSRNQELIKKLFYFNDKGEPTDASGEILRNNTLMIKNENYYFKKGDAKFFGIYPLLYKDTITCKYNVKGNDAPQSEEASIISLPINSTIHPDRIEELKKNNKRSKYIGNESEIINNIFMDGIGSDGLPYDQTYNSDDNKLGEIIRIERKFGNIKAEDVLEKIRSKNFVLLGYYLPGENKAIDSMSTIINPFMTVLQYMVDLLQKSQEIISKDTDSTVDSVIDLGIIANPDFKFCNSVINDISYVPNNVINSYKFLRSLNIINDSDCVLFKTIGLLSSASYIDNPKSVINDTLKDNFWNVFYKIYKYIFNDLYNIPEGEEEHTYTYHFNDANVKITDFDDFITYKISKEGKSSFIPLNKLIENPEEYTIAINDSEFDIDVINMYKYDLERFTLYNDVLQDNGNVIFCPTYVLFKNMREYFDTNLSDKKFYYTREDENGNKTSGGYKIVFSDTLLQNLKIDSTINNDDGTSKTLTILEIFDLVFKDFKNIKWDLLSADIIPDHFLEDATLKKDDNAVYDCSTYNGNDNTIRKALIEKMDKSAFFNEGKKGYFGTSHLYPWKNCFGIWFEFVGEPTNTGRPIIEAEIQTYTHNMCQGDKIIPYPESIMNTGIILSQYNTYNLDITVPLMNVAGYPFDYILRFGKPYPNIVSMLYRKLDSKINGSTIYDHVKELNDSSNYYYCRYPFVNNISSYGGLSTNIRPGTDGYTFDERLYPVDGYYGHETAGQEYGKSHERMYNYIYDINVSNKIGTIYRQRKTNNNTADYPNYNNYFGYTYKDCQKYTISSTDLVNVRDESGQDTSSITGGRTLWKNINTESQLIANISFLNSSSYNQHIGLYVSKDTTNNDYGIDIEEEVSIPEIEIPPTTSEVEKSEDINGNTLPPMDITYTQGINWAMPPKFQDYFSESNKIDIYKLFTDDELKWENNERYLDNSFYSNKLHRNNITLIPHYLGNQHASNLGDKFYLDLYYLTVQETNGSDVSEHTFLASRINYKVDNTYGTKRRWINFPANILGQIFDNDQGIVRLYGKDDKINDIIINNSGIWQDRYDLFCYFNHYKATLNQSKYVFDFGENNFNILGELMVKPIAETDYKECTANNYNVQNKNYKLILPTVDIKEPEGTVEDSVIDVAAKYKKYYRTYNHYLGISENTTDTGETSNEVYSYASKNTLFLRLKEYDNDDCALAHIDKYDALKEGQKLVPGFTAEAPRDKRPFSNRMCGWDVENSQ